MIILKRGDGNVLNGVLVCAGGLSAINVDFVTDCGGGGGSNAEAGHDNCRRVDVFNRKGSIMVGAGEICRVDIGSGHIVTKTVTGVVGPEIGVGRETGGDQIARSVRNSGDAVAQS